MKKQTFFNGVLILTLGAVISKVLGAVYRVPLTWILNAEGLGIYQLVFPIFSLILVISSTAVPTAISKMIALKAFSGESKRILKLSLIVFGCLSFLFSLALFFLSDSIAFLQGNAKASLSFKAISPSVLVVGIISCFRGYFQGKLNMIPTALSNILEQTFKLLFGLLGSFVFLRFGLEFGVCGAFLGITLGEMLTMSVLFIVYLRKREKSNLEEVSKYSTKQLLKKLLKISFPITLSNLILPLSLFLDSFLVINLLCEYGESLTRATILWGIESGIVGSIINLPSVLTLALATALVPNMSKNMKNANLRAKQSFFVCFSFVVPFFVLLLTMSSDIIAFLYGIELLEQEMASKLLMYGSGLVIFVALLQTQNAVLQGLGKLFVPVFAMFLGIISKTILILLLVPNPNIGIFGVQIAKYSFFVTAFVVNFVYLIKMKVFSIAQKNVIPVLISSVFMGLCGIALNGIYVQLWIYFWLPIKVFAGLFVYFMSYFWLTGENILKIIFKKILKKAIKRPK